LEKIDKRAEKNPDSYSGVTWDGCVGKILVRVKKGAKGKAFENAVSAELASDESGRVVFQEFDLSRSELDAILSWFESEGVSWVKSRGGTLMGWGGESNGVSIWVGLSGASEALKVELASKYPGLLNIENIDASMMESNTNDTSPYAAGTRIYTTLSSGGRITCTIGPVVYHSVNTGWIRALTAGHCGDAGNWVTHPDPDYWSIATLQYVNHDVRESVGTDSALLKPLTAAEVGTSNNFEGYVWESGGRRKVDGYTTGLPNDDVRLSGGISGTQTGLKVQGDPRVRTCYTLDSEYKCWGVTYVKPNNTCLCWSSFSEWGDSGGAVYSAGYPTYIYGMHLGKFRVGIDYRGVYTPVMRAVAVLGDGKWIVKRG
jgi:hypothetical protein